MFSMSRKSLITLFLIGASVAVSNAEGGKVRSLEAFVAKTIRSKSVIPLGCSVKLSYSEYAFSTLSSRLAELLFRRLLELSSVERTDYTIEIWGDFFRERQIRFDLDAKFLEELLEVSVFGKPELGAEAIIRVKKDARLLMGLAAAQKTYAGALRVAVSQSIIDVLFTSARTARRGSSLVGGTFVEEDEDYLSMIESIAYLDPTVVQRTRADQLEFLLDIIASEGHHRFRRTKKVWEILIHFGSRKTELLALMHQDPRKQLLQKRIWESERLRTASPTEKRDYLSQLYGADFIGAREFLVRSGLHGLQTDDEIKLLEGYHQSYDDLLECDGRSAQFFLEAFR